MNALTLLAAAAQAPGAMPGSVGSGMIQGGWGYVIVAYAIFWVGLALYALSLILRTRAVRAEKESK